MSGQPSDVQLRAVEGFPECEIGAPLPTVISSESSLILLYIAAEPDPEWDGTYAHVVSPQSEGWPIAVVTFKRAVAHVLSTIPDEETYVGHPYSALGLEPYELFEVVNSPWIAALEKTRKIRPGHWPERLRKTHHYFHVFHDSSFECIAKSFDAKITRGSIAGVAAAILSERDRRKSWA